MHEVVNVSLVDSRPRSSLPLSLPKSGEIATTTRKRLHPKIQPDRLLLPSHRTLLPYPRRSLFHFFSLPPSQSFLHHCQSLRHIIVFVIVTLLLRCVRFHSIFLSFAGRSQRHCTSNQLAGYSFNTSINHHLPLLLHPFLCDPQGHCSLQFKGPSRGD